MGSIHMFNKLANAGQSGMVRYISTFIDELMNQFNGRIDFVSNIRASGPSILGFTSSTQVIGVTHGLRQIPSGFLTINNTAPTTLFAPSGASFTWTDSIIYLKASGGCTATIYVI